MKQIVAAHGWPTRRLVGLDGTRAAWLLVQHADLDVAFQRQCLKLMSSHLDANQVRREDVAYLTDRVLVNEGKKQIYGTQFHTVDGKHQPRPMEKPDQVDSRRAAMGLTTLREYTELMHT